jgi:hypothetical protein
MVPAETYWSFKRALDYAVHRDPTKAREEKPFFDQPEWRPEVHGACALLWRALETGGVPAIEDGITPILKDRCRKDWEGIVGFLAPDEAGPRKRIVTIDRVTYRVHVSVDRLLKALPVSPAVTPETATPPAGPEPAPPPVAAKPRAARKLKKPTPVKKPLPPVQRDVKAALLLLFPGGVGTLGTYDMALDRLAREKKVIVSRATLVRVLPAMPPKWRKKLRAGSGRL